MPPKKKPTAKKPAAKRPAAKRPAAKKPIVRQRTRAPQSKTQTQTQTVNVYVNGGKSGSKRRQPPKRNNSTPGVSRKPNRTPSDQLRYEKTIANSDVARPPSNIERSLLSNYLYSGSTYDPNQSARSVPPTDYSAYDDYDAVKSRSNFAPSETGSSFAPEWLEQIPEETPSKNPKSRTRDKNGRFV
jgi:hypothetical protein